MSPSPLTRLPGRPLRRNTAETSAGLSVPTTSIFPPFNPFQAITWEAAFWASDPLWANPGDGNKVSSWRDGSPNGRDLSQTTDARRPIYKANHPELNNQAAVEFLNADAHRLVSGTFTVNQPNSWVAIFRFTGVTNNNEFMRIIDNNGLGGGRQLFGGRNATEFVGNAGLAGVLGRAPNNEPSIGAWYANGSSSFVEVNRQRSGNVNSGTNGVGSIGVGSDGGLSRLSGAVAFIGLYSGDVTADRQWPAFMAWATATYAIKG